MGALMDYGGTFGHVLMARSHVAGYLVQADML